MSPDRTPPEAGDRLAKVIARSGLCSRRDAESWIVEGRVSVNKTVVRTPAFNVTDRDKITVDGVPLAAREGTRVWLYHKPPGLVVTEKDPEGRETIFEQLADQGLPRVVTIGRLDINTEGLLLLTNDGGLKRVLELPATGWLRRYRVRAHGTVTQAALDTLKHGMEVDGINYGPIEAVLEREQGANVWLVVSLREGKNREVKNVLGALGLEVNRLIRVSFGPFQLGDLPIGAVETVKARVLKEQLGKRLAAEADVDFESDLPERGPIAPPAERAGKPGTKPKGNTVQIARERFRFTDRNAEAEEEGEARPPRHRPGRFDAPPPRPPKGRGFAGAERPAGPVRQVHFDDGRAPEDFVAKTYGKKGRPEDGEDKPFGRGPRPGGSDRPDRGERPDRPDRGDRPQRSFGDKPSRPFGDRPARPFGDRPARPFADKTRPAHSDRPRPPRDGGDRPQRADGPPRGPRPGAGRPPRGDRPEAESGEKRPFFRPRTGGPGGGEGARSFGDKPRGARPPRGDARPQRDDARPQRGDARPPRSDARPPRGDVRPPRGNGDRPDRKPFEGRGDRPERRDGPPRGPRPGGPRPSAGPGGAPGPRGGKPSGFKSGPRPPSGRPTGGKPGGGARPSGTRPSGPRPSGARPVGSRPSGPRPSGPRPPRPAR